MKDTSNANCRELLDVLTAQGVHDVVASPGSRNTPLLLGASARQDLRLRMINDERTAGFYALGLAMATQSPVALMCTSGTALYNYAPAVAEAFYQRVPLIVISADRPAQWIDQDDSQTLHQPEALDKIVKKSFDIPPETGMSAPCRNPGYLTEREWFVNRIANEAVLTATGGMPGPVHINIQFGEPLGTTSDYLQCSPRTIRVIRNTSGLPPHLLREICCRLMEKRVMVVAGFMPPDHELNKAILEFANMPNVTLLCETLSNIHTDRCEFMIDSLLCGMSNKQKVDLMPDIVITIGGALVSRMLKEYLRGASTLEHWTLNDTDLSVDALQHLTTHIDIAPAKFFRGAASMMRHLSRKGVRTLYPEYNLAWKDMREDGSGRLRRYVEAAPWSELKGLDIFFRRLDPRVNLFLSNGTCVRYAQLLTERLCHACFSNRGVSGIDGTNATAAGIAAGFKGTTILLTGDVSFAYCPEVLNPKVTDGDLRIVVVNNNGGGIFRFIRTTRDLDERERLFCSPPALPLEKLAEAYGWNYIPVNDEVGMQEAMTRLQSTPRTIVELFADADISAAALISLLAPQSHKI